MRGSRINDIGALTKRIDERDRVVAVARHHGHAPLVQGFALECHRCGVTDAIGEDGRARHGVLEAPCEAKP